MPDAKSSFLKRIHTLQLSIQIETVSNVGISSNSHNEIARMLRNGLAVVGFATLEDFIKTRTSEILNQIGGTGVSFSRLPEKLQKAAILSTLNALQFQAKMFDKSDLPNCFNYIQEQAKKIASTGDSSFEISPHAFGYDKSNISADTIAEILSSLNIPDSWKQITYLSSQLGLTGLPLDQAYKNASSRRHSAAHIASADTPQADIIGYINEALGIAIGFDCLISKALYYLRHTNLHYINGTHTISRNDITFRYIKYLDNTYKEYVSSNTSRAYRISLDLDSIIPNARSRASANNQVYVQFDQNNLIQTWDTFI